MKLTSKILLVMLLLFTAGLFASNIILKKEYNKREKNDIYWTYGKILEEPFKYLNIEGGNVTNIAYEQSKTASVRVFKDWDGYKEGRVKAHVKNDTLFITFPNTYKDQYEKRWLQWNTLVHIFSPELLAVNGVDTKLEMFRLKQNTLKVSMSGKSSFEVESMKTDFDSLNISGKDSSAIQIEMSPDYLTTESFHVKSVVADMSGYSILDVGHAQVDSLKLNIEDSSAVLLSGGTLKKNRMYNFEKSNE
ncbi:MAG TPA: hypothetical protein VGP55_01360 [Chitinophagaceae bacterium]|nr:hypothetical protein [Chitinophagaceae bacterium]